MSDNGVRWHSMAKIQRDTMPTKDRRRLESALAGLDGVPPERWPAEQAVRLDGDPLRYMLVLPRGVRAFVSPADGNHVEVHYVTHEETLRWLHERVPAAGHPG